jgi:putative transposase
METMRGYVYRLKPTAAQEECFRQAAGVCRLVYNLALEQRRDHARRYRDRTGERLDYVAQARELTALRAEVDFVRAVSVTAQQRALKALDGAFGKFFAGKAGYPRPRRRGEDDSFSFAGREVETKRLNRNWSAVRLPRIGWVRYRDTRPHGAIREATIRLTPLGWTLALTCKVEIDHPPAPARAVGGDRGVSAPLYLSSGERFDLPASLARLDRLHRRAQKTTARRRRGSRRYAKAQRRAAALRARAARIRAHWRHETTAGIARRFAHVVLEDLKTRNMTRRAKGTIEAPGKNVAQKRGLNRAILNVGWFAFETQLAYKLEARGGALIKVAPHHTSQTCSACGAVDSRSRKSQAIFVCAACGFRANADHNAAINIGRRGNAPSLLVEGGHGLPCEARTPRAA